MGSSFEQAWQLIVGSDKMLNGILSTTMHMALISSAIAFILGAIIGLLIAYNDFPGKNVIRIILRTLMGLPPVVVGIVLFILFSNTGPFGKLGLIYSVPLMIIAQIVLITPIAAGMTESSVNTVINQCKPTLLGLKISPIKRFLLALFESKYQLIAVYLFSFARAISEVGAVQIVGGNILYKTRVMTTAIALNYNTGDFSYAVALGIILLAIALIVNLIAGLLQYGVSKRNGKR
ncbi:MAG: ABC transporter permease [Clostridia bacterium]|nr:ABC transporter permease [Clostridia bacterium]